MVVVSVIFHMASIFLMSFNAFSSESEVSANFLCKNGKEVRTIRIHKDDKLCVVNYTKNRVEQVVGQSQSEQTCKDVLSRVKSNLEKGNWSCKDISNSRISTVSE